MRALIRVLAIGFTAVIVSLAVAAFIGANNVRSIARFASDVVTDQLAVTKLLDEVEQEQRVLNASFFRDTGIVEPEQALTGLDQTDREIARLADQAGSGPDRQMWQSLRLATIDFSTEARQVAGSKNPPDAPARDLLLRHQAVTAFAATLVDVTYKRILDAEQTMSARTARLAAESSVLVGGALVVALGCAFFTVRIAAGLFRQMQSQTGELSRVSFRLLQVQEEVARRFAHELHDELGGSLTAIKSDLAALAADPFDKTRLQDSVKLVEQSISNVRELSQLLRPTILDDFGLDASLRWLVGRFGERTGMEVEYTSTFDARLPDQTETHLFRIVQEALTNIARHAGATRVAINLRSGEGAVRLSISDNGRGLASQSTAQGVSQNGSQKGNGSDARQGGMGISGMRARAASAGGGLKLESRPGGGVSIEVWAPLIEPQASEPRKEFA
jgi:signal transduction histidine kinase